MADIEKVIEDLGTAIMCVNNMLTQEQFIVKDKVINAMIEAIILIEEQKKQKAEMGNAPITVQPLVRCKDCKWAEALGNGRIWCRHEDHDINANHSNDWFCADGERSDDI